MARSASSLPAGFHWLSPAYRPSLAEVEAYARAIAIAQGDPPEMIEQHRREAELQLWIWRNENRQRAAPRRRQFAAFADSPVPADNQPRLLKSVQD